MAAFKMTQLRHFSTVAELRSIGVAARVLHISQPALTRSIQRLEKEVSGQLFERGSMGVELTSRGRLLLPYARAILLEAKRAEQQLSEFHGQRRMQITLGTSANFAQNICPDIIADFVQEHPHSNIVTVTGTGEQLISMLARSELDLAITVAWGTTLQMALAKNLELDHETMTDMKTCVLAPVGHPLTQTTSIELEVLAEQRWAVPHGLSISYIFQDVFTSVNLPPPQQIINSSSVGQMLDLSKRLKLLLIIPRHVAAGEIQAGNLVPLPCPALELVYQVELITRRRGTQAAGLSRFRELACEHFARADLA